MEHTPKCMNYRDAKGHNNPAPNGKDWFSKVYRNWKVLVCTKCGKELETYYGSKVQGRIPDWVKEIEGEK